MRSANLAIALRDPARALVQTRQDLERHSLDTSL
jgi:hypothetical protein